MVSYRYVSVDLQTRQTASFSHSPPDQDRFPARSWPTSLRPFRKAPSTAGAHRLLTCIGAGVPWAVSLTGLSSAQALTIDAELQTFPPYVGMAALDLGNPTHREIMIEQMLHDDLILDRWVLGLIESDLPEDDRKDARICASWTGSTGQIRLMESEEFDKLLPALIYPARNSERGELSMAYREQNSAEPS